MMFPIRKMMLTLMMIVVKAVLMTLTKVLKVVILIQAMKKKMNLSPVTIQPILT